MRIAIFGGLGMLGKAVVRAAEVRGHEVLAPSHDELHLGEGMAREWIKANHSGVIINCVGLIPGSSKWGLRDAIVANSLVPHELAELGIRLIHMSTDCVFSGQKRGTGPKQYLQAIDLPDPVDLYGRSKLCGEPPKASHVLVVRGSFIGLEHGFLRWLLDAKGRVKAWMHAYWNGTSVQNMAQCLVELAEGNQTGIVHAAAPEAVTKAWMVEYLADALHLNFTIEIVPEPQIWRSLWPDIELPPVHEVLDEIVRELQIV